MRKSAFYLIITIFSLLFLSGCQITDEQQQAFNPEKAALARLKLGLSYLAQAKDPQDKSSEEIKLAHYNLTLANKYSPNNPNVMLGMALFDQQVGEYQEAEMIYQIITKMEPHNGLYSIHYGSFLCARNSYVLARQQFQNAIESNRPDWKVDGLEQLGYCAIQHDDIAQADEAFQALFNYEPSRRKNVENTAGIYQQNGETEIADYLLMISKK